METETELLETIPAMKRLTSVFKKKEKKSAPATGTSGTTNGTNGLPTVKEKPNGTVKAHPTQQSQVNGNNRPNNDPSDGPDHSLNRDGILTSIEKFGKVFHLAGRPLPSGTGDGTYITDEKPQGSFFDDLKSMRVKDFATLHMLLEKELNKGELTDDKTMVMERVIQVSRSVIASEEMQLTS